jgi:hypothetical protein
MRDLLTITLLVVLTAGAVGFGHFLGIIVGRRV